MSWIAIFTLFPAGVVILSLGWRWRGGRYATPASCLALLAPGAGITLELHALVPSLAAWWLVVFSLLALGLACVGSGAPSGRHRDYAAPATVFLAGAGIILGIHAVAPSLAARWLVVLGLFVLAFVLVGAGTSRLLKKPVRGSTGIAGCV
jgi:hypothetical protein